MSDHVIGQCSCLGGENAALPETDDLTLEPVSHLEIHHKELWLFPSLRFSCHGFVISWKLAASPERNGKGRSELSVWRELSNSSGNRYVKFGRQFMDRNPTDNYTLGGVDMVIHSGRFEEPYLRFGPRDVLGLLMRQQSSASYVPYLRTVNVSGSHTPLGYFIPRAGSPENDSFVAREKRGKDILPVIGLELCTCTHLCQWHRQLGGGGALTGDKHGNVQ